MEKMLTCDEVAQIVYQFAESKPSSEKQREFRDHIKDCSKCQEFIEKLRVRFQAGNLEVQCHEIPDEVLDIISRTLKKS